MDVPASPENTLSGQSAVVKQKAKPQDINLRHLLTVWLLCPTNTEIGVLRLVLRALKMRRPFSFRLSLWVNSEGAEA